jgi:hypothetical protein
MSETYARGGQEKTGAGGFIIAVASLLAAVLVLAGLIYAAGTPARHRAALAAAGCEPSLSPAGVQCTTAQMLTKRFLAIMIPARQQLAADQAAYTAAARRGNLAAAQNALTAEVTSEYTSDTSLALITFPPAVMAIAKALIRADEARATLTAKQAQSTSLAQLRSFNRRADLAGAAVQKEIKLIRAALASPSQAG